MKVKITPSKIGGKIEAIPSKSIMHRALICAALAKGTSRIDNMLFSQDIIATIKGLEQLGAKIEIFENYVIVNGIETAPQKATIDCNESGSTLRFLIPIALALETNTTFNGKGKLPTRPIDTYINAFETKGVSFEYNNTMPFSVSGKLQSGEFEIEPDISSQFITGLLFALPLLDGDSTILINGELQSKPYVDITIDVLKEFGIVVIEQENGYSIKGNQNFKPKDYTVEGDYSQAAFFLVAGALSEKIEVRNLNPNSKQGDKHIVEILKTAGANVEVKENSVIVSPNKLKGFEVDVCQIPDLVPILAVLASLCMGQSKIYGAERLKIKESDRLVAISEGINNLSGFVESFDDRLEILGTNFLYGGEVDSFNDHRIAMAITIASVFCEGEIIIEDAECINKSYPEFFNDFNKLGGKVDVINI
jgi:3-phosphoshikimate 1-carboxyvinyltransferase